MKGKQWEVYAFTDPMRNDFILADSMFKNPKQAWSVGLGWPSDQEIEIAKKRGCRVVKVLITEMEA